MRSPKYLVKAFLFAVFLVCLCFRFGWSLVIPYIITFYVVVLYLRHEVYQYEKEKSYQRIVGAYAHMMNCKKHAPANLHVEAVRNFCRAVHIYQRLHPSSDEVWLRVYFKLYRELKNENEFVREQEYSF
jgi:hypothetical protein